MKRSASGRELSRSKISTRREAIFVIGQNPGTNHPRMLTALERAKRNGCRLVHINPLPEVGMTRFKHPQDVLGLLGSAALNWPICFCKCESMAMWRC